MAEMSECSRHEGAIYYEAKACPVCAAEQDARDAVTLLLGAEATVETLWRFIEQQWTGERDSHGHRVRTPLDDAIDDRNAAALGVGEE